MAEDFSDIEAALATPAAPQRGLTWDKEGVPSRSAPTGDDGIPEITIRPKGAAPQYNDTAPVDLSDIEGALAKPVKLSTKMSNDQIMANLGYDDASIAQIKSDPIYKAMEFTDGKDFLTKEITEPGTLAAALRADPYLGGIAHAANDTVFGAAQLIAHGAKALGLAKDTTPAVFDMINKFNQAEYEQASPQHDSAAGVAGRVVGAVASGAAMLKAAAAGRAAVAGGATAARGVAATAAKTLGERSVSAGLAVGKAAASGAALTAASTPVLDAPASVGRAAQDAFWQQKSEQAQMGAIWAAGLHALFTGAVAGKKLWAGKDSSKAIAKIIDNAMANPPQNESEYTALLAKLKPMFKNPEHAERELNFAMGKITPTYGDITQGTMVKHVEGLVQGLPKGLGKFRESVQQPQVKANVRGYVSDLYDKMINAKFASVDELKAAVAGRGARSEVAANILSSMEQANLSPAQLQKISGQAEGIRKWLISQKKFAARDALAGKAAVPTTNLLKTAEGLAVESNKGGADNRELTRIIAEHVNYLRDPVSEKGYDVLAARSQALGRTIGKMGDAAGPLIDLRRAYVHAMEDFTDNVTKYAKAERYGITDKLTKPFFKGSKGDGYKFDALRSADADAAEPGVRMYFDKGAAKAAGDSGAMVSHTVNLRSPVIVEQPAGVAEFAAKLGLKEGYTEQQLTDAALQYAKATGHDGVVFTYNGVPRQVIDLTRWKKQIGDLSQNAKAYYKENMGRIESNTMQAIEQANPDNIIDRALDKKGVEAASNYFKALDDKGRAAVRAGIVERAVKLATDQNDHIDPAMVSKYLHERRDALGVFFKGEDLWRLKGFINLMHDAAAAGGKRGRGVVGSIIGAEALMGVFEGALTGGVVKGVSKAATTLTGLAGLGETARRAALDSRLRYYMLAAGDVKPGSAELAKLSQKFAQRWAALTAATAVKGGDE